MTRATYILRRFEIVAPHVRNDGTESGYVGNVREVLADHFTGWTEIASVGYWKGKLEAGTTFVLYAETLPSELPAQLRRAMPDQEAIQLVSVPEPVTLTEA